MAGARDLDEIKKSGVLRHLGVPYANFVTGSGDGMDVELVSDIQDMAVAFRKDSPKLRKAFDRFLDMLRKNGTLFRIALKYYPFVTDYYADFFKNR